MEMQTYEQIQSRYWVHTEKRSDDLLGFVYTKMLSAF